MVEGVGGPGYSGRNDVLWGFRRSDGVGSGWVAEAHAYGGCDVEEGVWAGVG